jgi:phosphate starvation-inducible PhoH-like protein
MAKKQRPVSGLSSEVTTSMERRWNTNYDIINEFELTGLHKEFLECVLNRDNNLSIVNGPAGSAKTYIAVLAALLSLRKNLVEEIVYIRSVVESASSKLGHLPGDINEKFHPWSMPLLDKLNEILSPGDAKHIMTTGIINCVPVNLVRGLTFKNSIVIVDECQNMTKSELITVLTRFGLGSKYILLGDCKQSDIGSKSGYKEVYDIFDDEESKDMGIHTFTFTSAEIVRHPLLSFICDKLDS